MAFWTNKDASPARKYRFKVGTTQNINWWYANSVTLPSFEINTNEYQLLNQKFKYPGVPTWNDVTISIVDVASAVEEVKNVLVYQDFDFLQEEGIRKFDSVNNNITAARAVNKAKADALIAEGGTGPTQELLFAGQEFEPNFIAGGSQVTFDADAEKKALRRAAKSPTGNLQQDFVIEQMKDDGSTLRTWTLVNSFIKSVNYGDLDYSSDDLVSIEITVAYDYATTEK